MQRRQAPLLTTTAPVYPRRDDPPVLRGADTEGVRGIGQGMIEGNPGRDGKNHSLTVSPRLQWTRRHEGELSGLRTGETPGDRASFGRDRLRRQFGRNLRPTS